MQHADQRDEYRAPAGLAARRLDALLATERAIHEAWVIVAAETSHQRKLLHPALDDVGQRLWRAWQQVDRQRRALEAELAL